MKIKSILASVVLALALATSVSALAVERGDGNPNNNPQAVSTQKAVFVYQDGKFVLNPAR